MINMFVIIVLRRYLRTNQVNRGVQTYVSYLFICSFNFCFYLIVLSKLTYNRAVFIWVSKSNWFCVYYATWLVQKLAPLFHPIRSKTKTNRDSLVPVFPRFASATCNYFMFWLVHLIICALCDWLEWLLWFWFYDTQLKTALTYIPRHLNKIHSVIPLFRLLNRITVYFHLWNENLSILLTALVLFISQDPTSALLQLAENSGMSNRFHALSLGQGQAPIATRMIKEGVKDVSSLPL